MIAASDSIRDEVIAAATVDDILRIAGVAVPDNPKLAILCPLHTERSPSFLRQKSGKGYRCQACGKKGGVLDLPVALGLAKDKASAVDFLAEYYHISKSVLSGSRPRRSVKPIELEIRAVASIPTPTNEEREHLRAAVQGCRPILGTPGEAYLKSRGLDPVFADACQVRYHPSWLGRGAAVVFPGRDRARRLVAAQGRFLRPVGGPKAMSRGKVALGVFSTPQALVKGLYGRSGPIAVTEAPLDALALAMNGLSSIATFGAGNRQAWLVATLSGRDVVIATDDDDAGEKAERELRKWLRFGTEMTRIRFNGCKDAAEMLERFPEKFALCVEEAIKAANPLHRAVTSAVEAVSNLGTPSDDGLSLLDAVDEHIELRPADLAPDPVEMGYVLGAWLWYGRSMGCYRPAWPEQWPGYGRCSECRESITARTEGEAHALFRRHVESGHTP